jgi:hypothetical protein
VNGRPKLGAALARERLEVGHPDKIRSLKALIAGAGDRSLFPQSPWFTLGKIYWLAKLEASQKTVVVDDDCVRLSTLVRLPFTYRGMLNF